MDIRIQIYGRNHPDVAQSLNNLAVLFIKQGNYEEAEPLHQEALEIKKFFFGDIHPAIAATLNNMAILYVKQGLIKKAIPLIETSLSILKCTLGTEHRKTKNVRIKLESLRSKEQT